ncbi:MAG: hypothetical protein ACP5P3_06945 [Ignavibacteria bacterium]
MKKAGLLESTKGSYFKITNLGLEVLQKAPKEINVKFLGNFLNLLSLEIFAKKKTKKKKKKA